MSEGPVPYRVAPRRRVLAVDPGPPSHGSGFAVFFDGEYQRCGQDQVEAIFRSGFFTDIVIEMITSYGMAVGESTFLTLVEIGRLVQMGLQNDSRVYLMPRRDIKLVMCGSCQAKDSNVRAAVLSCFPETGGGSTPQIGVKKNPGPLYGVKSHAWAAIAAGLAFEKAEDERGIDIETYRYKEITDGII